MYPQLYAQNLSPGQRLAMTGSGIAPILLSELEPGGKYGGKITYPGATGEGFDPLGLMKPGGKGTGLDLTIPVMTEEKAPETPTGAEDRGMIIPTSLADNDDDDDLLARMSALDMMQPNAMGGKITTEKNEDDRPKGLFGFLDGVELDGDALIKAGRAIEKGEGLGGAIEAYREEQLANQAADAARAEKKYDRERQAELDELDKTVKLNEIAYKKSQMTTDDQKLAQDAAIAEAVSKEIPLDSLEFASILSDKLDTIISSKKPTTLSLSDINNQIGMGAIGLGAYGDPDAQAALSGQGGNVTIIPMNDIK